MKKLLLLITLTIGITTYAQRVEAEYKMSKIYKPEAGEVSKKYIGESIIVNKELLYKEAVAIKNIPEFKSYGIKSNLKSGQVLPLNHTTGSIKHYLDPYKPTGSHNVYFGISIDTLNNKIVPFYSASANVSGLDKGNKKGVTADVDKTIYIDPDCSLCFSVELIYNGKIGDNIKFTYREFKGDFIRPAFAQDLQYDLSESNIIGFKTMRVEILKATNTEIDYKVLEHLKN